jgi:hypothetical protein
METMRTNLGNVMRQREQQSVSQEGGNLDVCFNTFLTLFGINLTHRFPDISDLDLIDLNIIRNVAEFSIGCTGVALEVWNQTLENRKNTVARQNRAA